MKFALVIPDGVADEPQASLGGRTPLQAARLPGMDAVAQSGVVGRANHVPLSLPSGSDVGTMSLFGYDPLKFHTGRAPIEAAAMGISLEEGDWAVRCNLVTIVDGGMHSFTSEQISSEIGQSLLSDLQSALPAGSPWTYVPGVSYRNLLIYRANREQSQGEPAPFSMQLTTSTPPHDITGQAIAPHLPAGPGAEVLLALMESSLPVFATNQLNQARLQQQVLPATQTWLWGLGQRPAFTHFETRFGVRGAVITAVDLLRGMGRLLGWDVIHVPGATGYLDTDYAAKGRAAIDVLSAGHDFIVVHVEATDEASHEGNAPAKVEALENIDRHIVQPLHAYLKTQGEYRLLICPDHPTFLRTKTHSHGDVPFTMCGRGITHAGAATYDEVAAASSSLAFEKGHELMPYFLQS